MVDALGKLVDEQLFSLQITRLHLIYKENARQFIAKLGDEYV